MSIIEFVVAASPFLVVPVSDIRHLCHLRHFRAVRISLVPLLPLRLLRHLVAEIYYNLNSILKIVNSYTILNKITLKLNL